MNLRIEAVEILMLLLRQLKEILPFWLAGIAAGAVVTAYASETIQMLAIKLKAICHPALVTLFAAVLGAASPVCMYGTIPLIASLAKKEVPQYLLAAFMISSVLVNPNLIIFSVALGAPAALIRLFNSILAGMAAGLLVKKLCREGRIFSFDRFHGRDSCAESRTHFKSLLRSFYKTFLITGPYVLFGILATALYQRFFPQELVISLFGEGNGFGVLLASALGIPVYVCGGGTIPLIKAWMFAGMSLGSVTAFMITGPATKLTNLSAVKTILGVRNFMLYLIFMIGYGIMSGFIVDLFVSLF